MTARPSPLVQAVSAVTAAAVGCLGLGMGQRLAWVLGDTSTTRPLVLISGLIGVGAGAWLLGRWPWARPARVVAGLGLALGAWALLGAAVLERWPGAAWAWWPVACALCGAGALAGWRAAAAGQPLEWPGAARLVACVGAGLGAGLLLAEWRAHARAGEWLGAGALLLASAGWWLASRAESRADAATEVGARSASRAPRGAAAFVGAGGALATLTAWRVARLSVDVTPGVFLAAFALGAALGATRAATRPAADPARAVGRRLVSLVLVLVASAPLFSRLPGWCAAVEALLRPGARATAALLQVLAFAASSALVVLPGAMLGALAPAAAQLVSKARWSLAAWCAAGAAGGVALFTAAVSAAGLEAPWLLALLAFTAAAHATRATSTARLDRGFRVRTLAAVLAGLGLVAWAAHGWARDATLARAGAGSVLFQADDLLATVAVLRDADGAVTRLVDGRAVERLFPDTAPSADASRGRTSDESAGADGAAVHAASDESASADADGAVMHAPSAGNASADADGAGVHAASDESPNADADGAVVHALSAGNASAGADGAAAHAASDGSARAAAGGAAVNAAPGAVAKSDRAVAATSSSAAGAGRLATPPEAAGAGAPRAAAVANDASRATETVSLGAHLGVLLHPAGARRVLLLGAGEAARALLAHPLEHLDVVERSAAAVEASRRVDAERDPLADARCAVHVAGPRAFLSQHAERWDVIVGPPGVDRADLRDLFGAARARLAPGGLLVWGLAPDGPPAPTLRALRAVFPASTTWEGPGALLVVASADAGVVDLDVLASRLGRASVADALARLHLGSVAALLARQTQSDDAQARWLDESDDAPGALQPPLPDERRTGGGGLLVDAWLGAHPLTAGDARVLHEALAWTQPPGDALLRGAAERWHALAPDDAEASVAVARAALAQGNAARALAVLQPLVDAGHREGAVVTPWLEARAAEPSAPWRPARVHEALAIGREALAARPHDAALRDTMSRLEAAR